MLGLLNTVLSKGNTLLTYVKDGLVMANRFLTPPKLTFPVDASAEFNGTSDFIDLDDALNFTTESLTISFWVNTTQTISSLIVTRRKSGVSGYEFGLDANGKVSFYIDDGSDNAYDTADSLSVNDGVWRYITFIVDRDDNKVYRYVDGSNSGTNTSISAIGSLQQDTQHTLISGRWNDGTPSDYFNGNLANVAIWNRALSSDEINSVMWKGYNALATTEKSGLQAWYKLEESELFDASNTSTTNLEEYAKLNSVTFEGKACLQTALNALPDITDARLYSAKYDIRVSADGGTVEALNCVETELNALL